MEEDRLNDSISSELSQNVLVSKQDKKFGKQQSQRNSVSKSAVECFKCGQKGHVKKNCRNKPCAKYLTHCRNNFPCNTCNQKGRFAKECPKENSDRNKNQKNNKDDYDESKNSNRRALITIGLSTANVNHINTKHDCNDLWYQDCAAT